MCGATTDVRYEAEADIDALRSVGGTILVFDRNYVAFQALLDLCPFSSLVDLPMFTVLFERSLVAHADR